MVLSMGIMPFLYAYHGVQHGSKVPFLNAGVKHGNKVPFSNAYHGVKHGDKVPFSNAYDGVKHGNNVFQEFLNARQGA